MSSKEIKKELDRVKSITVLANSDGGKILIVSFHKDIINNIDKLAYNYAELTHIEMITICANLRTKLELLRTFNNSKKNKEIAEKDLEEALKEEGLVS